jgi:transposase
MPLYGGIDLHASSNHLAIMDENRRRVMRQKLANDPQLILGALEPYKTELVGVVVESTYNWYWIVDLLMDNGYVVHLANPSAIQQYRGLKHADDTHDAFWLAELLNLRILKEGYIYPKEVRPVRDLLRKRQHLVRLRTSLILSLENIVARNCGVKLNSARIKQLTEDHVHPYFLDNEDLALAGAVSKESVDFFTGQITRIERVILKRAKLQGSYQYLVTLPGFGKIVSLTVMLETGPISRFAKVGNYGSYCRKVASRWTSNEKTKGSGNRKNGNKYLAWAFSEAAEHARRYHGPSRDFYNRKLSRTNFMVAHNALAHKLARAAYYIIRDNVPFDETKLYR